MSDRWTVQIVPPRGGRTKSVRVGGRTLVTLLAALVALAGSVAVWALVFADTAVDAGRLASLREENRQLSSRVQTMERRSDRLAGALDQLAVKEERFRLVAGLPLIDPEVREVGIGGPPAVDQASFGGRIGQELDRLMRRADLLSTSLSEATDSMRVSREVFLSRPSIRPVASRDAWISSGFSRSRLHPVLHDSRPHTGIDITARGGAPILAAAQGRVTHIGETPGYGKMVEIDHGYGYKTRYAHASDILVARGERVQRGDVIGKVGETGLTTGPNLHYEVLVNGRAVDPRPFLLDERLFQ